MADGLKMEQVQAAMKAMIEKAMEKFKHECDLECRVWNEGTIRMKQLKCECGTTKPKEKIMDDEEWETKNLSE